MHTLQQLCSKDNAAGHEVQLQRYAKCACFDDMMKTAWST